MLFYSPLSGTTKARINWEGCTRKGIWRKNEGDGKGRGTISLHRVAVHPDCWCIHPLTPIMVISRPLSASSIYYDPRHSPCSIYVPDSLFHNLCPSFLWSTSWSGTLHFILHAFLHPVTVPFFCHYYYNYYNCFTALDFCPGLPRWAGTRKVKPGK